MSDHISNNDSLVPAAVEQAPIEQRREMHPLVHAALASGTLDPATLEKLLELQRQWEDRQARRAFTEALVRAKASLPSRIKHDAKHGQKSYTYSTIAQITDEITGPLADHGFSLGGDAAVAEGIVTVTVTITHHQGHSESTTLSAPPDRGAKTKSGDHVRSVTEAIGATITSLRRYATLLLLGLATAEDKPSNNPERIDIQESLRVLGGLAAKHGTTRVEAEEKIGKPLKGWNIRDLRELRAQYENNGS